MFRIPKISAVIFALSVAVAQAASPIIVPSIAALRLGNFKSYTSVTVAGWNAGTTYGGGLLTLKSGDASTVDNGCTVFVDAVGDRFFRDTGGEPLTQQMCGAKGDNIRDDTTAIQAALNVAASVGLGVYCPSGTYKITANILMPEKVAFTGPYTCTLKPSSAFPGGTAVLSMQTAATIGGWLMDGGAVTNTGVTGVNCIPSMVTTTCQAPNIYSPYVVNFNTTGSVGVDASNTNKFTATGLATDTNKINMKIGDAAFNLYCYACLWKSAGTDNILVSPVSAGSQELHFIGGENVNAGNYGIHVDGSAIACGVAGFYSDGMHLEANWQSLAVGAARNAQYQSIYNQVCDVSLRNSHFEPSLGGSGSCNQEAKAVKVTGGRDSLIDYPVVCQNGTGNIAVADNVSAPNVSIVNWPAATNGIISANLTTAGLGTGCVLTNQNVAVTVAQLPTAPCVGSKAVVSDATQDLASGIGTVVAGSGADQVSVGFDGTDWLIGG